MTARSSSPSVTGSALCGGAPSSSSAGVRRWRPMVVARAPRGTALRFQLRHLLCRAPRRANRLCNFQEKKNLCPLALRRAGLRAHTGQWDTTLCLDVHESTDCALRDEFDWALPFDGGSYFVSELNAPAPWWPLVPQALLPRLGRPARRRWSATTWPSRTRAPPSSTWAAEPSSASWSASAWATATFVRGRPLMPQPFDALLQLKGPPIHPLLRLTTFSLGADENGDLTTGNTRRLRYYSLPESVTRPWPYMQHPVALWL
jgi:hypothetical protein